MVAYLGIYS